MNITKEHLEEKIGNLKGEQFTLEKQHVAMTQNFQKIQNEFQQKVAANQVRFHQITGALSQLTDLMNQLNGVEPPPTQ